MLNRKDWTRPRKKCNILCPTLCSKQNVKKTFIEGMRNLRVLVSATTIPLWSSLLSAQEQELLGRPRKYAENQRLCLFSWQLQVNRNLTQPIHFIALNSFHMQLALAQSTLISPAKCLPAPWCRRILAQTRLSQPVKVSWQKIFLSFLTVLG